MHTRKWILLILAIMYLPAAAVAQPFVGKDGRYVRKGCKAVLSASKVDTQMVVDPITGEEVLKARFSMGVDSINGKRIYNTNEVTSALQSYPGKPSIEEYLVTKLKKDLEALHLPDGVVQIDLHSIVIDEKGSIVYYEYRCMTYWGKNETVIAVNEKLAPKISKLMAAAPAMKPAILNGVNVLACTGYGEFKAEIKNHVVTYKKD